ncbi:activating signal cointegrator 1 complex subunit 2 [Diachasma alloeum]|uniref:activating signal cointegrator 1 complex subunit 2 n=1 Tax=Diachasma alloeum TaxID=454923 RepID=UPI0007382004|nr:activating signal cointegrator 1 complex subunit 2 [Diachasma alloeum]
MMNDKFGRHSVVFQNLDHLPVEKVQLAVQENGTTRSVSALSNFWVEKRHFLHYEEPFIYGDNGQEILGSKDRWLKILNHLNKDFQWLLCLPYHKFWSNIIYNESIIKSMSIFLVDSPTFYTIEKFPNDERMHGAFEHLARNVLITFARIVTNQESSIEFMDKDYHGKLIYDKYLMTVTIMWDLCQLYGRDNDKVVEKIVSSAIKLNPLYSTDFKQAVAFLIEVFTTIEQKIENSRSKDLEMSVKDIEDMVVHLLDLSTTIEVFLKIYSPAIQLFSTDNFIAKLVTVYGTTLPQIYKQLEIIGCDEDNLIDYAETKHFLEITRVSMIKVFRTIIHRDIALILEQPDPSKDKDASQRVDKFLNHLTATVMEKDFLKDYNTFYPIDIDLDLVAQITDEIDHLKKNFILQSVSLALVDQNLPINAIDPSINCFQNSSRIHLNASASHKKNHETPQTNYVNNTPADTKNQEDGLLDLIKEVKGIMCHLGEGFIAQCLKHYNNNPSAVINALLEDSLPQDLKGLDRELPYIPPDPMAASAAVDETLGFQRLNVFDGDEFDIMTRDSIDTTRVHKGKKKDKYKNLDEMLNDKSFKNEMSTIYQKYGIVEDEYDDEYDDTYDSQDVGPGGVDDPVEMDAKSFTIPRILRVAEKPEERLSEDDNDEEEESKPQTSQNGKANFCENPEVLRARAEQRRLSRGGVRNKPQGDVVGKPKGQGNEKDVLVNRDKKNTNKSSRANHNRRSGAEWKRRQGMVPS